MTVEPDVKLEVLDWGGPQDGKPGRPLVFLSGLGDTAHVYDEFAPRFTAHYHVYGITRRGFGASSKPEPTDANYSADRLGEDVVAVIDALHLDHPVLAGHSIAGEELSWVGNHDPKKVAGLIYLDAGDYYGFYDQARGNSWIDMLQVKRRLDALRAGAVYDNAFVDGLRGERGATPSGSGRRRRIRLAALPDVPAPPAPPAIPLAVWFGMEKFTKIDAPAMAIFACPHDLSPDVSRAAGRRIRWHRQRFGHSISSGARISRTRSSGRCRRTQWCGSRTRTIMCSCRIRRWWSGR